jgi:hypothetical protein
MEISTEIPQKKKKNRTTLSCYTISGHMSEGMLSQHTMAIPKKNPCLLQLDSH